MSLTEGQFFIWKVKVVNNNSIFEKDTIIKNEGLSIYSNTCLNTLFLFYLFNSGKPIQDTTLSRLLMELEDQDRNDTTKSKKLNQIAFYYLSFPHVNTKKTAEYNDKNFKFSKSIKYVSGIAGAYNIYAICENRKGN